MKASLNDLITTGTVTRAQRITIYGPHGIGKSTLASQFPKPIFIDSEEGTSHLAVNRIVTGDYATLCRALDELPFTDLPCRTVVIDTIDHVETLLRAEVCREHRIAGMEGLAYGKGWVFLTEKFAEFISRYLDPLIAAGIHVLVIGHSSIKRIQYPGLDGFDRWELRLYSGCANRLKEWSDAVLFLNFKTRVIDNEGKPKGTGGKQRTIYTTHDATYDAKVRIELPEGVPCTFDAIKRLLCNWERPPRLSLQEQFAAALSDIEPKQVIAFLIDRKQIRDDQQITDVPAEYAQEALRRISEFRKVIAEFDFIPM
jgi:hypothetical protein